MVVVVRLLQMTVLVTLVTDMITDTMGNYVVLFPESYELNIISNCKSLCLICLVNMWHRIMGPFILVGISYLISNEPALLNVSETLQA